MRSVFMMKTKLEVELGLTQSLQNKYILFLNAYRHVPLDQIAERDKIHID